jgi:hypothetical protein
MLLPTFVFPQDKPAPTLDIELSKELGSSQFTTDKRTKEKITA